MTHAQGATPERGGHWIRIAIRGRNASLRGHYTCLGLQVLPSRPVPVHAGPVFRIHVLCVSNSSVPRLLCLYCRNTHSRCTQVFWFRQNFGDERRCTVALKWREPAAFVPQLLKFHAMGLYCESSFNECDLSFSYFRLGKFPQPTPDARIRRLLRELL